MDFGPINSALEKTDADSKAYEAALKTAVTQTDNSRLAKANEALYESERGLILSKGLPSRDWYRHQIYAPGLYTGYGAKTLPGVREAVEASRWDEANTEARDAARALEQLNQHIEQATRILER